MRPSAWFILTCALVPTTLLLAPRASAEQAIITEIHYHPLPDQPEYIEIYNNSGAAVDFARWRFVEGIDYEFPDFSEADPQNTFMCSFERILVASVDEATLRAAYTIPGDVKVFGPWGGSLSNAGERLKLEDKNGARVCDFSYNDDGRKWPIAPDGTGHTLRLVNPNQSCGDWRNWTSSAGRNGTPGSPPASTEGLSFPDPEIDLASDQPIVEIADTWKYDQSGNDLGTAWREPDYNDDTWPEDRGIFGKETKTFPAPGLNDNRWTVGGGKITYYLRKQFVWNGGVTPASISINAYLDDGAVYYLNGQEIGRTRLLGVVDYLTEADPTPQEVVLEQVVNNADVSGLLVQGTNTLAVEVHNQSSGSSDIIFGGQVLLSAPPGGAIINEVLPGAAGNGFIEFYNPFGTDLNLRDHYLSDDQNNLTKFPITTDTIVPAGGLLAIDFAGAGFTPGAQTTIYLTAPDGSTMQNAIDAALGLDGKSLGRKPSGATDWFLFDDPSPGEPNTNPGDLSSLLVINEAHLTADGAAVDWVEVRNVSNEAVPVGGLFLASQRDFSDRVAISGTLAGGVAASWDTGFAFDNDGEIRLYLITAGGIVIDAVRLERSGAERSIQRDPRGANEWYRGAGDTRDAPNVVERITDIVINEIMADPPSNERNGEFVELYNRGTEAVNLTGWSFVDGINFDIPAGTVMQPGDFLVVAANAAWINSVYGIDAIGDYPSRLANEGELLRLEDAEGDLADQVDYGVRGDWPILANGDGSSLELTHPHADNDLPTSWQDSDETQKSTFETFRYTGTYHHLPVPLSEKELHIYLVGDSHVVMRNMALKRGGTNILSNHTNFTTNGTSATGWLRQGTHHATHFDAGDLHVVSDGHGDNRANKLEIDVSAMNANDELTFEFEGRWVYGKQRIVVKTLEDSFVCTFRLPIPNNLGTPGAPNSRLTANPATGLSDLGHAPAVPTTGDNVLITARVAQSPAPTAVDCVYREDSQNNSNAWSEKPMNDTGTGGDAVAGDGIYSAFITDQKSQGRVVQFYVRTTAPGGQEATLPAPAPVRPAMYIVDDNTVDVDVNTYRFVYSAAESVHWGSGRTATYDWKYPRLSNSYKNLTFIVNDKEVIYNCEIRPSASPWHAGDRGSLLRRGKWRMPSSHRFRGLSKLSWDNTPAAEGVPNIFNNKVPRYQLYLMGHPMNENEFATIIDRTTARHSVEVFEPVGNDYLERNFGPDGSQGDLFRPDDVFFFNDTYNKDQITNRHWWYAGDEWPGPGRYHSQWLLRSREADYDYSALINLLKTVRNDNDYTEEEINRLVDAQKICLLAAVRGYIGDWDSFTLNRPKNSFFYRPPNGGRFHFIFHDSDLAYQNTGETLINGGSEFGNWSLKPYNRRIFRYYLAEILDKWLAGDPRLDAWFECEDAVSSTYDPNQNKYTVWDSGRRSRVTTELGSGYTQELSVDPVGNTSDDVISISGEAGYRVWEVQLVGHPEATFTWVDETNWRIDGIVLQEGENNLQVVGLDDDGLPAFGGDDHVASRSLTKTSNAPPVIVLDADPRSQNVGLAETFVLDPGDSFDPEGGALTFDWTAPGGLASFSVDPAGVASANFDTPGLYEFTVTATDPDDQSSSKTIEAAVYGPGGFSTFGEAVLDPYWEEFNIEPLSNSPGDSWYSLDVEPGRMTIQLPADARPLGLPPGERSTQSYIALGDSWSYQDLDVDVMATFADPAFDDSGWAVGPGLFGDDGSSTVPAPGIGTPLDESITDHVTYYLRKEFEFAADPVNSLIALGGVLDDGVRFWLNGQELDRVNLPAGVITHSTVASSNFSPERSVIDFGVYDGSGILQSGTNVLAADLHNSAAGSSDILLGVEMDISANPVGDGVDLDNVLHPWIRRPLPVGGDWVLQTEVELQTVQFGDFSAGLLVESEDGGNLFRYGLALKDGESIAVLRVNPSGTSETLHETLASGISGADLRIRRTGDTLFFSWEDGDSFTEIYQLGLAAGTTFSSGGPYAASEEDEAVQAVFDYAMLIESVPQSADAVVVSEIMYNPAGGATHEFLELYNAGQTPVDLAGYQIPDGDPFAAFTIPGPFTLQAGAYGLLVANQTEFLDHYGAHLAPQIIAEWGDGKLSNSGEVVTILDAAGAVVASFSYDDDAPWPEAADGDGASLVIVDEDADLEPNSASNWRASELAGGSPGGADGTSLADWLAANGGADPAATYPGGSVSNLVAFAIGLDLAGADALPEAGVNAGGIPTLSFRQRLSALSFDFTVEVSSDLQNWTEASDLIPAGSPLYNGDGTQTVVMSGLNPVAGGGEIYYRVRVTQ